VNSLFRLSLLIILVFTIVAFSYSAPLLLAQNSTSSSSKPPAAFVKSFEKLVKEAHNLTQSYQNEIGKWKAHQYDNKTMISVTNNYLPKYENLVNEAKTLQPPKQYQNATDIYTKSLESELQSYIHFRNYLSTNNSIENELSSKFLDDAFKFEIDSFKALKSSGMFRIVP
jgi:phospholipase/lecithinase/hemolysin